MLLSFVAFEYRFEVLYPAVTLVDDEDRTVGAYGNPHRGRSGRRWRATRIRSHLVYS